MLGSSSTTRMRLEVTLGTLPPIPEKFLGAACVATETVVGAVRPDKRTTVDPQVRPTRFQGPGGSLPHIAPTPRRKEEGMFFSYLTKELRRRRRQAVVVSLGLALGIGLVVSVSAMAAGVKDAQATVLHSLYGVGTDITVTQSAAPGSAPGGGFRVGNGAQRISRDQVFSSPGQTSFDAAEASTIANLAGVRDAAGGLTLNVIHIKGKLPTFTS